MAFTEKELKTLSQKILKARSVILTTHKSCDADGLASVTAFHHVLKNQGKKVRSVVVDEVPARYDFMNHKDIVEVYENSNIKIEKTDLAVIFDTNDYKLVEPLYSHLTEQAQEIIFIDHHCPLESRPSKGSLYIDESSASTGELCFFLIEQMGAPITQEIARAIYISIIFDTNMFRSSKNLSGAFYTCSKLCHYVDVNDIYEQLFCRYDQETWSQMLNMLNNVQYNAHQNTVIIECLHDQFKKNSLSIFHILDCLELAMKRQSILAGFACVEKQPGQFKLSFRSKKSIDVSKTAEFLGGGGHQRSAGASVRRYSRGSVLKLVEQAIAKKSA